MALHIFSAQGTHVIEAGWSSRHMTVKCTAPVRGYATQKLLTSWAMEPTIENLAQVPAWKACPVRIKCCPLAPARAPNQPPVPSANTQKTVLISTWTIKC